MIGLLEALAAISVGKLILLGFLSLIVGIPVIVLLVGMVIVVTAVISDNAPWGKHRMRVRESISLKTRALGWGIFFLAVGLGILAAVASNVQVWGIAGIALLFSGIGLIIFYFVAARTERKKTLPNEEEEA